MNRQEAEGRGRALGETVGDEIRRLLVEGELVPGQRLSESALGERLGVSRNTLREAFRSLAHEGLVTHRPNRGVFVTTPSLASIVDIYRVRRFIECQALREALPSHPALQRMREAVEQAGAGRERRDWQAVGSSNMAFHAAIVALADSPRLDAFFHQLSAELRLAFGMLSDLEWLHGPYVALNQRVLEAFESGDAERAAMLLEQYLSQSERTLLAAYARDNPAD
ncbi:GntR family transcriptional regulator [Halomonas getboli]|uniref:GntR family transcriptional regulator n=1 Tax=Halomonas getboli TaxID=2935862 RepID=UPI001FFEA586|nr:GntR family transcriptional regulator [Halomonas getboli]MCK2184736.1 GntR family transcriptional regulator [Halomonas getboli]